MGKESIIRLDGIVEEALPGLFFKVKVIERGGKEREVLAHMAGKMKMYRIRIVAGDRVTVELPSEGDKRGRIVRRL